MGSRVFTIADKILLLPIRYRCCLSSMQRYLLQSGIRQIAGLSKRRYSLKHTDLLMKKLSHRSASPLLLLLLSFTLLSAFAARSYSRTFKFEPGFDATECEDILRLNFAFSDTAGSQHFTGCPDGYTMYTRTPAVGLDNMADIWLRSDSTVVLMLRGTTARMESILEDFYCAMLPAAGRLQLDKTRTFDYRLADDPRAAVHAGFLIGFAYLADHVRAQLDTLYHKGYRKFIVGGHSQGGALCYYFSAWLLQLKQAGTYPGILIKTYASAAPKMGNMYFAYDYDNTTRSQWSFSIVNTYDPIPEMPFTTQQVVMDMNEPNPILNLMKRFDDLPFFKRIVLKNAFGKMKNRAEKSSEAYQKYLGRHVGDFIHRSLPDLQLPAPVATTYFVRPGVPIILSANRDYLEHYKNAPTYYHHGLDPYRFLLRAYYEGLPPFAPLSQE